MNTKEAVEHLCSELRKDSAYYVGWQANIAMAFQDAYSMEVQTVSPEKFNLHRVANDAAKNFLDLLIRNPEERPPVPYRVTDPSLDALEGRIRRYLKGETIMGLLTRELSELLALIREVREFRSTLPVKD